jgi:heme exporter protein D
MSGFFAMGGYATYIWPAYIVVAVVLAALWIVSARTLKAREADLERAEAASPRRTRP